MESDEQVKGYAVGKDQFVVVEDDELANVAIESSHTVDIEKFVPKVSIDDRYRDTPYYLAPEDKVGQEAFAVIRDAMKKKKMVGIARVQETPALRFGRPESRRVSIDAFVLSLLRVATAHLR